MKKKLFIITIIITIIGILVVAFKGFNVSFEYKAHKAITVPINTDFSINDIKSITDEIFGKDNAKLEKAGVYKDEVIVSVSDATDEQINTLKDKINEKYSISQKIIISIGDDYNVDDIKEIAKEVFGKEDVNVEKYSEDETYVSIEANLITNDELENLNNKINEKYSLTNETSSISVSQVITENDIPKVRLTDMAKQYYLYLIIATVIILLYFAVRFYKLGAMKTVVGSIILSVLAELLYMAIIAITRYPIDKIAIMGFIVIYIVVMTSLNNSFMKQTKTSKEKSKSK